MRKTHILTIVFLLTILSVNASVELVDLEDEYLIEEDIEVRVMIDPEIDAQAVLSAELLCEEYEIIYFIQPLDLKEDEKVAIKIPPFKIFDRMIGTCIIDICLNSILGAKLDKTWTDEFEVINQTIEEEQEETEEIVEEEEETEEEQEEIEEEITGLVIGEEELAEETIEIKEEQKLKTWLYITLLIILIAIIVFFYLKHKIKNKHPFNKDWKI